ncbi:hypothetical protein phiOC_p070 [Ochrobactrum phage vB_OspM_OC]|nr:hypothetical protein phiOC_p070 [Ochrobactrum phage vB_OspM_OC]
MSNIDEFLSALSKGGISKSSNFSCIVTSPTGSADEMRDLTMRIEAADIAGRNTTILEDTTGGFPTKVVVGSTMNELPLSIILSEDLKEKIFMEKWQDLATGSYRSGTISKYMYNPGYYNDYVGTVLVYVKNDMGDTTYEIEYENAFPALIGNISYSWENGQAIAKLPVTFIFKKFIDKTL